MDSICGSLSEFHVDRCEMLLVSIVDSSALLMIEVLSLELVQVQIVPCLEEHFIVC